jgi:hypothetical protein
LEEARKPWRRLGELEAEASAGSKRNAVSYEWGSRLGSLRYESEVAARAAVDVASSSF